MYVLRATLLAALCSGMLIDSAFAQLRGGNADRDRDRGVIGRLGARRDEWLNRNAPPQPPANPNAAVNPNVNPNLRGGAYPPGAAGANAAGGYDSAAALRRMQEASNARAQSANRNGLPTAAPQLQGYGAQGNAPANNARSAYYAPLPTPNTRAGSANPNSIAGSQVPAGPIDSQLRNEARQASAVAPANRLPYSGPGVLIRLPRTLSGEVNYLVDEDEHLVIHAGEDQLLRLKGSYEVRFSRGVTEEGKSFGEARYTVTEGVYRFDVSDKGWELYREGEAGDVRTAIAQAEKREADARQRNSLAAEENAPAPLPPVLAPRDIQSPTATDKQDKSSLPPPSPTPPTNTEETLPAPKSILEPA